MNYSNQRTNALNLKTYECKSGNSELMNYSNIRMNALKRRTNEWMPTNSELMNYCNLRMNIPWTKEPMNVRKETMN